MPYKDPEERKRYHREYGRKWRQEHPDRARASSKRWRESHPEEFAEYQKTYRSRRKHEDPNYWKEYRNDWWERNPDKRLEYSRQDYKRNRSKRLERARQRRQKLKIRAVDYLGGKCVHCSVVDHPCIYDFHHLDPEQKDFHIGAKLMKCDFDAVIKPELDKCVLLCSPCHRKVHMGLIELAS